jgi:hypothetical protein
MILTERQLHAVLRLAQLRAIALGGGGACVWCRNVASKSLPELWMLGLDQGQAHLVRCFVNGRGVAVWNRARFDDAAVHKLLDVLPRLVERADKKDDPGAMSA